MTEPMMDDVMGESQFIDGAELLNEVCTWLGQYICVLHDDDLHLLTLWAVHTWVVKETYTTARLLIDSPTPGSGKTTVLEHLERLSRNPVQMASVTSSALLARLIEKEPRTLLIDEADRALRPDKEGVGDLLAVLNSGYKVGGSRPVLVPSKGGDWQSKEMTTFSPVAMAGNSPNIPDDTRSRCIRVLLLPDVAGTVEDSDWEMIDAAARELGKKVSRWADQSRDEIRRTRPPLPEGVRGRNKEKWLPLKRVAVVAGAPWPERVDRMAAADLLQQDADREDGLIRERPAVVLLKHLQEVFEADEFLTVKDVVNELIQRWPEMWGDGAPYGKPLTAQRLGKMLTQGYRINSSKPGGGSNPRGYTRSDLTGAWRRMGMVVTAHTAQSARDPEPDGTPCPNWVSCPNGNCKRFEGCVK